VQVICHRGATEFAHENTLEAYRAAFELGADGNEIDIRATSDGVLVCFHDDMLDHLLEAYGDVSDYKWDELRRFRFRDPGPFGPQCRIPTLVEVFELHRQHSGLMHLDIKRPEITDAVMQLVEGMDMWDHVIQAPPAVRDARVNRGKYKGELYLNRGEVDVQAITAVLHEAGDSVILEDPRGLAIALGRALGAPSSDPVSPVDVFPAPDRKPLSLDDAIKILLDADDWDEVACGAEAEAKSAGRILRRAEAADAIARENFKTNESIAILRQRVVERSLHRDWRYQGLDGAAALRALVVLGDSESQNLGRMCLWRDDPAVEAVRYPGSHSPRSWADWRTKLIVFPELAKLPGQPTERICRDYLALTDEEANAIGILCFEAAARTLLQVRPDEATAGELMRHRRGDVCGRAILFCLKHSQEDWAERALKQHAPHTLAYVVPAGTGKAP
jgi:hypothetical protein